MSKVIGVQSNTKTRHISLSLLCFITERKLQEDHDGAWGQFHDLQIMLSASEGFIHFFMDSAIIN
jgi:hypothetical protein